MPCNTGSVTNVLLDAVQLLQGLQSLCGPHGWNGSDVDSWAGIHCATAVTYTVVDSFSETSSFVLAPPTAAGSNSESKRHTKRLKKATCLTTVTTTPKPLWTPLSTHYSMPKGAHRTITFVFEPPAAAAGPAGAHRPALNSASLPAAFPGLTAAAAAAAICCLSCSSCSRSCIMPSWAWP